MAGTNRLPRFAFQDLETHLTPLVASFVDRCVVND